jgi:chemotaxis protein MotB
MSSSIRLSLVLAAGALAVTQSGCNAVPGTWLRSSQLQLRNYHAQTKQLQAERDAMAQQAAELRGEQQRLAQEKAEFQDRLGIASQRLGNLENEREALKGKIFNLTKNIQNPLSDSATRRFELLDKRFPGFNFDPDTGVSKFSSDIVFDSGSSVMKSGATPILSEFAKIMNDGEARRLSILVVGHTDDQQISARTAKMHPTNWELSVHRAASVVKSLETKGLRPSRMGVSGYSKYQPIAPNTDPKNRSQNRRVEIYVLAPEAAVAGWDPAEAIDPVRRN